MIRRGDDDKSLNSRRQTSDNQEPCDLNDADPNQPQYMNITSLDETMERYRRQQANEEFVKGRDNRTDLSSSKILPSASIESSTSVLWQKKTIGPDAWYNDDFNYDKAVFVEDPFMNQQYGQLLNIRYQEQLNDIVNPPSAFNVNEATKDKRYPEESGYASMKSNQTKELSESLSKTSGDRSKQSNLTSKGKGKESSRRRLKDDGRSQTWHSGLGSKFEKQLQVLDKQGKQVLLNVSRNEESPSKEAEPAKERRARRKSTSSKQHQDEDKVPWSPAKAFEQMRKVKEAPPKNLVQDRMKTFQDKKSREGVDAGIMKSTSGLCKKPTKEDARDHFFGISKHSMSDEPSSFVSEVSYNSSPNPSVQLQQKKSREIVRDFALSDSKDSGSENILSDDPTDRKGENERKRSVKELLSDFEEKSRLLAEQEESDLQGGYLDSVGQTFEAAHQTRRRVFSDTETMLYDSSTDEQDDETFKNTLYKRSMVTNEAAGIVPASNEHNANLHEATEGTSIQTNESLSEALYVPAKQEDMCIESHQDFGMNNAKQEDQYMTMTPPMKRSITEDPYLQMSTSLIGRKSKNLNKNNTNKSLSFDMQPSSLTQSQSSLTSSSHSRGSNQSIPTDSNLGVSRISGGHMTPTEALIASSSNGSITSITAHNRTPSQTMVIEHLQQEFGQSGIPALKLVEESYVDMSENEGTLKKDKNKGRGQTKVAPQKESPNYCEIEDADNKNKPSQTSDNLSHYEYLYKASSSPQVTGQNYESVYQEISDDERTPRASPTFENPKHKAAAPLKAIEGLPDILGNAPGIDSGGRGHSSSDADDEAGLKDRENSRNKPHYNDQNKSLFESSDTFMPASFFLSQSDGKTKPEREHVLESKVAGGSQVVGSFSLSKSNPKTSKHLSNRELPPPPDVKDEMHRGNREGPHHTLEGNKGSNQQESSKKNILPHASRGDRRKSCPERPPIQANQTGSIREENIRHGMRKNSEPVRISHPTILKQNINLTYQSVYENDDANFSSSSSSELQSQKSQKKKYSNEGHETLTSPQKEYYHESDASMTSSDNVLNEITTSKNENARVVDDISEHNLKSRIPYYVADIDGDKKGQTYIEHGTEVNLVSNKLSLDTTITTLERAKAVDKLEDEMKFLDAETSKHLSSDFDKEYEKTLAESALKRIRRRAHTPDSFLLEKHHDIKAQKQINSNPILEYHLNSQPMLTTNPDGVVRSRSLEGLLGDGHAGPRDCVEVHLASTAPTPTLPSETMTQDQRQEKMTEIESVTSNFDCLLLSSVPSTPTPLPARGREPPPPPEGVPPLDIRNAAQSRPSIEQMQTGAFSGNLMFGNQMTHESHIPGYKYTQDQSWRNQIIEKNEVIVQGDRDEEAIWKENLRRASERQKLMSVGPSYSSHHAQHTHNPYPNPQYTAQAPYYQVNEAQHVNTIHMNQVQGVAPGMLGMGNNVMSSQQPQSNIWIQQYPPNIPPKPGASNHPDRYPSYNQGIRADNQNPIGTRPPLLIRSTGGNQHRPPTNNQTRIIQSSDGSFQQQQQLEPYINNYTWDENNQRFHHIPMPQNHATAPGSHFIGAQMAPQPQPYPHHYQQTPQYFLDQGLPNNSNANSFDVNNVDRSIIEYNPNLHQMEGIPSYPRPRPIGQDANGNESDKKLHNDMNDNQNELGRLTKIDNDEKEQIESNGNDRQMDSSTYYQVQPYEHQRMSVASNISNTETKNLLERRQSRTSQSGLPDFLPSTVPPSSSSDFAKISNHNPHFYQQQVNSNSNAIKRSASTTPFISNAPTSQPHNRNTNVNIKHAFPTLNSQQTDQQFFHKGENINIYFQCHPSTISFKNSSRL